MEPVADLPRSGSYEAPAARLAIRLIECLSASEQPLGVGELARRLESNNNMVFRLLHTLEDTGWIIRREDAKYEVGLRAFHYASMPIGRMSLSRAADGPLQRLWEQCQQSLYLGVVDGDRTLFLRHLDAVGDVRITGRPGGRYRMHCAAPGKVLLAFGDSALSDRMIAEGLPAQTAHTITDPVRLRQELAQIREVGWAVDAEEYSPGVICFAAPVFDVHDRLSGTVGVSVLTLHFSLDQLLNDLGPQVIAAANATSASLGATRSVHSPPIRNR